MATKMFKIWLAGISGEAVPTKLFRRSGVDIPSFGPLHTCAIQNQLSGMTGLSQDQKSVPKTKKPKDVFPYSEGLLIEFLDRPALKILPGDFPELS